jgi:hypothetical protein
MTTVNASYNWNWMRMYGDAGFLKKKQRKEQFVYDSGLKLGY